MEKVENQLIEWSKKIEELTPEGWKILLKEVYVGAVLLPIKYLFITGGVVAVFLFIGNLLGDYEFDKYDKPLAYTFYYLIGGGSVLASSIVTVHELFDAIGALINPKYRAIHDVSRIIKK